MGWSLVFAAGASAGELIGFMPKQDIERSQ
jgi:hypothetical protein